MALKTVSPPIVTRGPDRRYSVAEVRDAAKQIRSGVFISDDEEDRQLAKSRGAAFQRGRTLRKYLVAEQNFEDDELTITVWKVEEQWTWAIGLK